MGRVVPLLVAVVALSASGGCGALGWYRSLGHLPGIAPTDYAFSFFCGTASQLYPLTPPQVEGSMMEALGDLGFQVSEPPTHRKEGSTSIRARTPDGRPAQITISPQNAMTNVRVVIGPCHLGDYELSRDLLRRVALNLGTVMRAFTPVETTLPRRINLSSGVPHPAPPPPPEFLQGEGLRPGAKEAETTSAESTVPGSVVPPIVPPTTTPPGGWPGFIPTRSYPNPPNMPYAPFPYTPYGDGLPY